MRFKNKNGFTLVELLVVLTIIGILAAVTAGNFIESQRKSRDAARKANLRSLAEAVSTYYADYGVFPAKSLINFGGEFSQSKVIYMKKVPIETISGQEPMDYAVSSDSKSFRLITNLENDQDKDCVCYSGSKTPTCTSLNLNYTITNGCGYMITSSNIGTTEVLK